MALIEVVSDSGVTLIDDTYKNMCLLTKGALSFTWSGAFGAAGGRATVTVNTAQGETPFIALSSSFTTAVITAGKSGNTTTWTIACDESGKNKIAEYFVFYIPSRVPNANGILQLFNEAGELVFDSGLKYSRFVAEYPANIADPQLYIQPAGRKYAICHVRLASNSGVAKIPGHAPIGKALIRIFYTYWGSYVSGNTVGVKYTIDHWREYIGSPSVGSWTQTKPNGKIMVLDVTGY